MNGYLIKLSALLPLIFAAGCSLGNYSTRMHEQLTVRSLQDHKRVILVDFDKSIYTTRLFVVNPQTRQVIFASEAGHARKSGRFYAKDFSNVRNSLKSALGLYRVGPQYVSRKHGLSFRLIGLDKSNSNALKRGIVLHGSDATYSSGCITVNREVMTWLLKHIKPGTKLLVYQ